MRTTKGFSLYGSALYSSDRSASQKEDVFYVPHMLNQLAGLPANLQPEDIKLYQRIAQSQSSYDLVIKRDDIKASEFDVTGVDSGKLSATERYKPHRLEDFVVNWVTVPNIYQASLQTPLQIRTSQLIDWKKDVAKSNLYNVASRDGDSVRESQTMRYLDTTLGGNVFSGGVGSGMLGPGDKSQDEHTFWVVDNLKKMKKLKPLNVESDLIRCTVDGSNTDNTASNQSSQNETYWLDAPLEYNLSDNFQLCHRKVSVDYNRLNKVHYGTTIDDTSGIRVETSPMNLLNVTTTLVNTLGKSHSVLPINLAELKIRPMWFKDILFLGTDPKTQQDLIFQSYQRGVQHTLSEFKRIFKVKKLPYEQTGEKSFLEIVEESIRRGKPNYVANPTMLAVDLQGPGSVVSAKWLRLLQSALSTATYSLDILECFKEFGLTEVLLEGSKILTLSHNFLLRCVGTNQDGSVSERLGECYEECLPFDIVIEKDKASNLGVDGASKTFTQERVTFSHLKQLELFGNSAFYRDTGEFFNKLVMTQPVPHINEGEENTARDLKRYIEKSIDVSIPPHLKMNFNIDLPLSNTLLISPSIVKVTPKGPRGAFTEAIAGNDLIEEVFSYGCEVGHILSEKIGKNFESALSEILKRFHDLKRSVQYSVIETRELLKSMVGVSLSTGIDVDDLKPVWMKIEITSLFCMMVTEICQLWFQQFDVWMVQNANIRDLLFHYNNHPHTQPSAYEQDWKAVGCVGQASWYAGVQWVFSMFDLKPFPEDSVEKKHGSLFFHSFFDEIIGGQSIEIDHIDLNKYVAAIYDSLRFYFYSALTCLAPSPKGTVSPSAMHQLVRETKRKINNQVFFGEWCLFVDGIRPVIHDARTLSSLFSKKLYKKYFQKYGLDDLYGKKTMEKHKKKGVGTDEKWVADFIPLNGCMLIKQSRVVPVASPPGSKVSSFNVGLPKSQVILYNIEKEKTALWYPFQLQLTRNPIFHNENSFMRGVDYLGLLSGNKLLYNDSRVLLNQEQDLFLNSPNEYCLTTGDETQSQRFSPEGIWIRQQSDSRVNHHQQQRKEFLQSKYSILRGLYKCVPLTLYPMKSSTCIVQGIEILKEYFQEMCALEKLHLLLVMSDETQRHERRKKSNGDKAEIKISSLDHMRYKQIRYSLQQLKIALNQLHQGVSPWRLSTTTGNDQSDKFFAHEDETTIQSKANQFFDAPQTSPLSSYSLEWHRGSEYGGIMTFISKGDLNPTLYKGDDQNQIENAGIYTLWLINENPNRQFTTSSLHESSLESGEELKLVNTGSPNISLGSLISELEKVKGLDTPNWDSHVKAATPHLLAVNKIIDTNIEKVGKSSQDNIPFNPIHAVEDVYNCVTTGGFPIFNKVFEAFSHKDTANGVGENLGGTLDFTTIPSFTLTKVCTLELIRKYNQADIISLDSHKIESDLNGENLDTTIDWRHKERVSLSELERQLDLVTGDKFQPLEVETFKQEPITNTYSIQTPYLTHLIKDTFARPQVENTTVCSKYMGGDYLLNFTRSLGEIPQVEYDNATTNAVSLPHYLQYGKWKGKYVTFLTRTMLQHFLPTGLYNPEVVHLSARTPLTRYLQTLSNQLTKMFLVLTRARQHSKGTHGYLRATLLEVDTVRKPLEMWLSQSIVQVLKTYLEISPVKRYDPKWSQLASTAILGLRFHLPLLTNLLLTTKDETSGVESLKRHCSNLVSEDRKAGGRLDLNRVIRRIHRNLLVTVDSMLWWTCYSLYEILGQGKGKTKVRLYAAIGLSPSETSLKFTSKHRVNVWCSDVVTGTKFAWNPRSNIILVNTLRGLQAKRLEKERKATLSKCKNTYMGNLALKKLVGTICEFASRHILFNFISKSIILPTGNFGSKGATLLSSVPFWELLEHTGLIFSNLERVYEVYHKQGGDWNLNAWENANTFNSSNGSVTWFERFSKGSILNNQGLVGRGETPVELMRICILQAMDDMWLDFQAQCRNVTTNGIYDLKKAMTFLEKNEDRWTRMFVDLVQSLKNPHNYRGSYDEKLCESLNVISKDFLLYSIFRECNRQVNGLKESIGPLFTERGVQKKKKTLNEWYNSWSGQNLQREAEGERGFETFYRGVREELGHTTGILTATTEQLRFLWDLISKESMTCGSLMVSSTKHYKLADDDGEVVDIDIEFYPLKKRQDQGSQVGWLDNCTQVYLGTWEKVKSNIANPKNYDTSPTKRNHPIGSLLGSLQGLVKGEICSKSELLKLFGRYFTFTYSPFVDSTLDNTVFLYSRERESKLYRHYEASLEKKNLNIFPPITSCSQGQNMFFFEEWVKTCLLPSLMYGFWMSITQPDSRHNPEIQEELQQQWARILEKLTTTTTTTT